MTDNQTAAAEAAGGPILHIPMTSGAEAIIYNLPGINSGTIKLTGDVLAGTTAATEGITLPDDMKIMITNSSNPDAYPIAGFTWILAYVNQKDQAKGLALVNMLWWAIHDGQQYGTALDYASLSSAAVANAENEILSIKYQGQPLKTR